MSKTDNELIAEFMGGYTNPEPGLYRFEDERGNVNVTDTLEYDSSWDWLMSVVEKIEGLPYSFEKEQHQQRLEMPLRKADAKISYAIVVEFIKWYNSVAPEDLRTKQQS